MNKYLKMLMLSGGLIGAIAPTAIDIDRKDTNNDLGYIYNQVERMQDAIPRLSRIDYKLNINLDNDTENNQDTSSISEDTVDDITISTNDEIISDEGTNIESDTRTDNLDNQNNQEVYDTTINNTTLEDKSNANVSFSTTDEDGNITDLSNSETLNYLDQTLNQTNIEYENLKEDLTIAIRETMNYLDAYKNGEQKLTNEQKIYIKEHSNSIKFLAETLEDLSEEVICAIDCKECDDSDDEFEKTAGKYLTTINELETRIQTLQNAISSLHFINNISNPFFNRHYYMMYDFNNNSSQDSDNLDGSIEVEQELSNSNNTDEVTDSSINNENNESVDNITENNSQSNISNSEDEKPTTFGLKSNIDTYAPTRRNIDTFFNTARLNDDYMYGGGFGYGMPYGFGGNYAGYGNPYGAGFGNPYGASGLNSNMVNRATLENYQNNLNNTKTNGVANIENSTDNSKSKVEKPKKFRAKRAKNVDTYTGVTIRSNINTMGESKITKFFKEKFNNLRRKVKNQKDEIKDNNDVNKNSSNQSLEMNNEKKIDSLQKNTINNEIDKIDNSVENNTLDQLSDTQTNNAKINVLEDTNNTSSVDSPAPIYAEEPLTR